MLAVERANMDLFLFVLFVGAVLAWRARTRISSLLGPGLIVVAAIAKLYAIFALPAYAFTGKRQTRWVIPVGAAAMTVYLALTLTDFRQVLRAPEGGLLYSYGARILIGYLYHSVAPGPWLHGSLLAQLIAIVPLMLLSVAVWRWARARVDPLLPAEQASWRTLAFHLGALTYIGTFLTRKSGDYRLVFLLLTLPLLFEWVRGDPRAPRTVTSRVAIVTVVAGLWVGALSPFIGPWDELASWGVALVLTALLAATVPQRPLFVRTDRRDVHAVVGVPH
jgi:hypothetical protein